MTLTLSIIIPIYNSESYLGECIKSVLNCTPFEMECILINDGSTDLSSKICNDYSEKDKRIKVFHIENHGVSYARNFGISKASGEYILFLDSDDYLTKEAANLLGDSMKLIIDDIVIFDYIIMMKNHPDRYVEIKNYKEDYRMKIQNMVITSHDLNYCWGKLFKRSIIVDNNIMFNENLKYGEDSSFVIDYLKYAKNIKIVNRALLHYRVHENSAMQTMDFKRIVDMNYTFKKRMELSDLLNVSRETVNNVYVYYFNTFISFLVRESRIESTRIVYTHILDALNLNYIISILNNLNPDKLSFSRKILYKMFKNNKPYLVAVVCKIIAFIKKYKVYCDGGGL